MGDGRRLAGQRARRLAKALGAVTCGLLAWGAGPARAFNIDTGVPDLKVRWDNTIKYSAAFRTEKADSKVESDSYIYNLDDGDRNFNRGLISNRIDVLSEFDAVFKGFGVRASGAGWYDWVYNKGTDNNSRPTANQQPYDEFPDDTRDLHGRKVELLDAFAFGRADLWENGALSVRLGRYTLLYGESLFFGANGVAAAQAPIDVVKLLSVPNAQFKEIGMPVPQVSGQLQILQGLSLGGYYQFEWRKSRLPAAGSYFSYADVVDDGGERFYASTHTMYPGGPLPTFYRGSDIEPTAAQFGAQLKVKPAWGDIEYGLYAARYNEKTPVIYLRPDVGAGPMTPVTGQIGDYVLVYPQKIWVYGASAATAIGDANVSAEVSYRHNTPLTATGGVVAALKFTGMGPPTGDTSADGDENAAYPVGDTFHAQMSMIQLFSGNFLWDGASLVGEIAYNRRVKVQQNESELDPNCTKDALAVQLVFEPQYFQVLPQLDLSLPLGFAYAPYGRSSLGPTSFGPYLPTHGGNFSIGLSGEYLKTWKAGVNYTHYFGPRAGLVDPAEPGSQANAYSYGQTKADRDFVSFSIQRTF